MFRAFAAQHQHERDYFLTHQGGEQYRFASECTRLLRKYDESRARESDALVTGYRERANAVSTLSGEPSRHEAIVAPEYIDRHVRDDNSTEAFLI